MEALEFVTKIKDKQIIVPHEIQSALENNKDKEIRVIVLIEEDEKDNFCRMNLLSKTRSRNSF